MQTSLSSSVLATPAGAAADRVLRSCVHCGFCNATCPTYRLLGDELDGPRGRIYLIKEALERGQASRRTQVHLDRCLSCRACETTCPSGVNYHRLLDIGRDFVDRRVHRPAGERLARWTLRQIVPYRRRFTWFLRAGQFLRPLLPTRLRNLVPAPARAGTAQAGDRARKVLLLPGCAQPALAPSINAATVRVLDRLGIKVVVARGTTCCGALSFHLGSQTAGRRFARRNIDAWWTHIQQGAEAIVTTASGCGAHVKEYAELLGSDPAYRARAQVVAEHCRDLSEIVASEQEIPLQRAPRFKIAFHSPCTLQHAQRLGGNVESLLRRLGFELTPVPDPHLCCGSAGAYSLLQQDIATRLRDNKLQALQSGAPERILTANIGCQQHLAAGSTLQVQHWIEALDACMS